MNKTLIIACAALTLNACANAKQQLGVAKKAPDEFAVVKRAPLSMPPDYALRPPSPGAPRPQEQSAAEQAEATVFGQQAEEAEAAPSSFAPGDGEAALLKHAGAGNADPNIRNKVDAEQVKLAKENVPVAKKIFGLGKDTNAAPASVVDAKAEAERLKANQQAGKPATSGETPSVER